MSDLATANRKLASRTTRVPLLRILAVLSVVIVMSGVGVFTVMNRQNDVVEQTELQDLDELDLAEFARAAESRRLEARSVTATLTDVVTADHQESSTDDHSANVTPAGMTDTFQSGANPTVWLLGTIEDSSEASGSDSSDPRRRESSPR
jgi:type II secretory pathway pseudopilin PulG